MNLKSNKLTITIVFILSLIVLAILLFFAGIFWAKDLIKVVAEPYPEILKIHSEKTIGGSIAYSITKDSDKVVITRYGKEYPIKVVHTYLLKNNLVDDFKVQIHYSTKFEALQSAIYEGGRIPIKNVTYLINPPTNDIGLSSEELINSIETGWKSLVKIDELK